MTCVRDTDADTLMAAGHNMPAASLLSLTLALRPTAPSTVPEYLGRAAHAVLLDALEREDQALGARLHAGNGPRPVTASGLIGARGHAALEPGRTYRLRYTALTAETAGALRSAAARGRLQPGAVVELDSARLVVEALDLPAAEGEPGQSGWLGADDYDALTRRRLLDRPPAARLGLEFASPTTFHSGGRHVPLPLPDLVFGSLAERWNAFAPAALPVDEVRRFAAGLALSRYRLHSEPVRIKDGLRIGAVGRVVYTVGVTDDDYWPRVLNLLADFALFAGVGAGTALGLGQCRRLHER